MNEQLSNHKSVLVEEVLAYLSPGKDKIYVDATFGSGGHTRAILTHEPTCHVVAIDWDQKSLDTYFPPLHEEFGDRVSCIWGNFAHIYKLLKKYGIGKVDGILADFGTSQMQIFTSAGFSFSKDTPLDMRMSPAHYQTTATQVVNDMPEKDMIRLFQEYGEEPFTRRIVRAIIEEREKKPILTTRQLAALIERVVPARRGKRIHPATRVFQALRIYVNEELENIGSFLPAALAHLNKNGRLVCISFHSLEDRMVKTFFKEREKEGNVVLLTKRVVTASQKELEQNPSARSAKLRALMKQ